MKYYGRQNLNFTFIGAGSYSFTASLVGDILAENCIAGGQFRLVDIDAVALERAYEAVCKMVTDSGKAFTVNMYKDYQGALPETDFLFLTFVTGSYPSWKRDIDICTKHGVLQAVGDTIGPGGIIRAIRNIPVVYDIAKAMEKVCPDAWIINYTNPEGAICLAIQKYTKIKSFGLCHGTPDTVNEIAQHVYGLPKGSLSYRAAGINHLTWITELWHDGQDLYPTLKEKMIQSGFDQKEPISFELFQRYGLYPAPGDRHVEEFFPFYLSEEALAIHNYQWKNNDFVQVEAWREESASKFDLLSSGKMGYQEYGTSGETATHFIRSLLTGETSVEMANVMNQGYINNVSDGIIVEIPVYVDGFGLHPDTMGDLPSGIAAKCECLGQEYELMVEAAILENRNLALQAMMIDPLMAHCADPEALLEELLTEYKGQISDKWFV